MSKEHLISKAILQDQPIFVSGFDWCKGEEKSVGVNSLQRKILCEKHNNDLSPADAAAKHAIDAFEAGSSDRTIDGYLFERWLVKTAVNLSIGGSQHVGYGMADSKPGWSNPYLIAVAFGDEILTAKMGAYFLFPATQYVHRAGEIQIVPIQKDGQIGGFVFGLRGQYVFLSLFPGDESPSIAVLAPGLLPEPIGSAPLVHRPTSLRIRIASDLEGEVRFHWSRA